MRTLGSEVFCFAIVALALVWPKLVLWLMSDRQAAQPNQDKASADAVADLFRSPQDITGAR